MRSASWKKLLLAAATSLAFAPLAMSETDAMEENDDAVAADDSIDLEARAVACYQFDRQPRRCENFGCFYNYRTDRCTRGGGGGGGNYFVCDARDRGWEEHWSGHQGTGWTQQQAANRAVRDCRRYHGSCYVSQCYLRRS